MALIDGLKGYYELSNVLDNSNNGNNLIDNSFSGTTSTSFVLGKAEFAGDTYLTSLLGSFSSSDFTSSFWIRPTQQRDRAGVFCLNNFDESLGVLFRYGTETDQLYVFGSCDFNWSTANNILIDEWTHVVLIGNNGTCKAYINNALIYTLSYDASKTFDTPVKLTLAAPAHALNEEKLIGSLNSVGVWDRALTENEVNYLFNLGRDATFSSLTSAPTPSVTSLSNASIFDKFAFKSELGKVRFIRLRHLGYL